MHGHMNVKPDSDIIIIIIIIIILIMKVMKIQ